MSLDKLKQISESSQRVPEPQVTVNDIEDYNFGMPPEQVNLFNQFRQQTDTGRLPWKLNQNDYYPGYHPGAIGQGSDMFGSFSTYGPMGALVPQGVFDARDQAIHNAAFEKAKQVDAFKKEMNKLHLSKLTNINDHLANGQIDFVQKSWNKALKASGNNPAIAAEMLKNDPEYNKGLAAYENAAKMGDAVSTKFAEIEDAIKTRKFMMTPSLKQSMEKLSTSLDPTSPDFKNAANHFATMNAEHDFATLLDDITKNAFASETGRAGIDTSDPEFLKEWESSRKEWTPEQKADIAKVIEEYYPGSDYFTPERIKTMVDKSLSGVVKTRKENAVLKREDNTDGGVTTEDIMKPEDVGTFNGKFLNSSTNPSGEPVSENVTYNYQDGVTFKKPVSVVIPVGKFFEPETGDYDKTKGNVKATVGGAYNIPVWDTPGHERNGKPAQGDVTNKKVKYETFVAVQYTKKTAPSEGAPEVESTHSVWVPLKTVKNAISGKDNQNKAVLDEIEKRAQGRNTTQAAQTTETAPASKPTTPTDKDPLGLGL